jgi:hypothetical protein
VKFGFDVHGVVDTHHEVYAAMTSALVDAGHEVHIVTGNQETPELVAELTGKGIRWTHWFSIVQYHLDRGDIEVRFEGGQPWMDKEIWNRTKAEYCEGIGLSLMIDDSPVYGSYFLGQTIYCLQKHPKAQEAWMALAGRI